MQSKKQQRPITIHLPPAGTDVDVKSRADARRLARTVAPPPTELIAVLASTEHELRALATGGSELVQAISNDGYPFVCLVDLLEVRSVWIFTRSDACDAIRHSLCETLGDRSKEIELDVSCLCATNPDISCCLPQSISLGRNGIHS